MKRISLLALAFVTSAQAQLFETFSDGDFSADPQWVGDTSSFTVSASGQLQSASNVADHRFFLSTRSAALDAEWIFHVELSFSTSSLNYVDVYLSSFYENILRDGNTGYFVRLGYTQDEISLYRRDHSGETKLIDGLDGALAGSNNAMVIKVSRSPVGRFSLSRDVGITGNFFPEGSVTDLTYISGNYFGILVKQGSSSFFQKHFFDDISIGPYQADTVLPSLLSVVSTGPSSLDITFSEAVETSTALSPFNYSVDHGVGLPNNVMADAFNPNLFHLTFFNTFPEREELRLSVAGISDLSGNFIQPTETLFSYFLPNFGDVLIHEIMADPSPPQQLPDQEWIELRNNSGFAVSLANFKICKSSQCTTLPAYLLLRDSMVALTSLTRAADMSPFGPVIGLSNFPSLSNSGEQLSLYSPSGSLIHAVEFSDGWYGDEYKKQGGFSLEMLDKDSYCAGKENWAGSVSVLGGTPGRDNAGRRAVSDQTSPEAIRVLVTDSMNLVVEFSETLDSSSAPLARYAIIPGNIVATVTNVESPMFKRVSLSLSSPLSRNLIYQISIGGVKDCAGNPAGEQALNFGLPETVIPGEILVNELLFNPHPDGVDFVELVNNSNRIFSLGDLLIANRNASGELHSLVQITNEPVLIMPGDFFVITESFQKVREKYITGDQSRFIALFTPSMPDDEGEVVILNRAGEIIDEVAYTSDWHYPLITNEEGISLERISYSGASGDPANWHSAASSHGFATPALINSQNRTTLTPDAIIQVEPKIISPNRDGTDDYACIFYGLPANGYTANLTIFDANGHLVRYLCRNELCGGSGFWKWDGLGENGNALPAGVYIIFIELLNPAGDRLKFKEAVALFGETL